jgi:hypothetical protein
MLKGLIFLTAFSQVFLSRFGIPIGSDFSLSPCYFFLYLSIFIAAKKRLLYIDIALALLFLGVVLSSAFSYFIGEPEKSLSSLTLLWFIYLPFVFMPRTKTTDYGDRGFLNLYYKFLMFLAVSGIVQFLCQFLFRPDWLFDYRPLLPVYMQNKNPMNTVIPIGGFIKSNGFFLLEPAYFSQWMAYGIAIFLLGTGSYLACVLFFLGLLVSFSGTGLILLGVIFTLAAFFPKRGRLLIVLSCIVFFMLSSLLSKDNLLISRLDEFKGDAGVRTTSAAARFKNPAIVIKEGLMKSPTRFLLGYGPGTISKVTRDYETHDPVWAKLFFEYGIVGGCFLIAYLYLSCRKTNGSALIFSAFVVQWFCLGGHLLTFDVVVLFVLYYKLAPFI